MPKKIPTDTPPALTHSPFAALGGQAAPPPATPEAPAAPAVPKGPAVPARAVVRLERKGRSGKEVTVIEQLALRQRDLEATLSLLKKSLGCGGTLEGQTLVLQGDQRERAAAWLTARGVPKVIRGS